MAYKIVVDAGHGGADPGAVYDGRQEKDDTLSLALKVGELLRDYGIDVVFTRTTDVYQTPFEKAQIANNADADFFLSIHRNSSEDPNQYEGVETLVYDRSGVKLEMAEAINQALEDLGFKNLGVKERPGLVVLRRTKMPAVLVEVGFINSDTDNRLFDDNFDDIALAIAEGILGTLDTGNTGGASGYTVQVGAYRNPDNADRLVRELRELDFPAELSEGDGLYLVTVGAWPTLDEAAAMEQRLKRAGYQTLIISR